MRFLTTQYRQSGECETYTMPCASRFDATLETPRCCVDRHVEVLAVVAPMLDGAGVRWWIDYGMLLGWMTGGGWYWNDRDIDVSVHPADRDKVLAVAAELRRTRTRWLVVHRPPDPSQPWRYSDCVKVATARNRATLDISFYVERRGVFTRHTWADGDRYKGREVPPEWVFPVQRTTWEGVDVPAPRRADLLVEYRYGPGWRNLPATRTGGELRGEDYLMRFLEAKAAAGPAANKAMGGPAEDKRAGDLAGVDFASDEAAEFAAGNALTASDFAGIDATGVSGYTKADVRQALAAKG
jgi:hypothetical protein